MAAPLDQQTVIELQKINVKLQTMIGALGGAKRNPSGHSNQQQQSSHSANGKNIAGSQVPKNLSIQLSRASVAAGKVADNFNALTKAQLAYTKAVAASTKSLKSKNSTKQHPTGSSDNTKIKRVKKRKEEYNSAAERRAEILAERASRNESRARENRKKGKPVFGSVKHALKHTAKERIKAEVNRSPLVSLATLAGSFALLEKGAQQLISQFHTLRQSGFQNSLMTLSLNTMSMGISLEALTRVLDESKATVNDMGLDNFTQMLADAQSGLMTFGMTTTEATKFAAAAIVTSRKAGLALNSIGEQKAAIDGAGAAYAALRATTSITTEQFAQMNATLMLNDNAQKQLLGMNKLQKSTYVESINLERRRLAQLQLTVAEQTRIIQSMQDLAGLTVKSRMEEGARYAGSAAQIGLGAEGQRAFTLMSKKNKTEAETAELTEINIKMAKRLAELEQNGPSDENRANVARENLGPAGQKMVDGAVAAATAIDAGQAKTADQLDKLIAAGKDSAAVVGAIKVASTLSQVVDNPLVKIGLGVIGITWHLVNISRHAATIARNTGGLGGLGGAGGRGGRGGRGRGGILGRAGAAAGRIAGTTIGTIKGLAGAGVGILGSAASAVTSIAGSAAGAVKGLATISNFGKLLKGGGILGSVIGVVSMLTEDAKDINMKSDILGGTAQAAMAALGGPWVLGITAATKGIIGSYKGWQKAGEFFETDAPTLGQKFSSAIGGLVNGISFGIISGEAVAKGFYGAASGISDAITGVITWIGAQFSKSITFLTDTVPKALTSFGTLIFSPITKMYDSIMAGANKLLGLLGIKAEPKAEPKTEPKVVQKAEPKAESNVVQKAEPKADQKTISNASMNVANPIGYSSKSADTAIKAEPKADQKTASNASMNVANPIGYSSKSADTAIKAEPKADQKTASNASMNVANPIGYSSAGFSIAATEIQRVQRSLGANRASINTNESTPKTTTTQSAVAPTEPVSDTAAVTDTVVQASGKAPATLTDLLTALAELVELQKAETLVAKSQLDAIKDLSTSKRMAPADFVRS